MLRGSRKTNRRTGFTLLEVLMVVVILGILAAVVVPNLFRGQGIAQEGVAKAAVESGLNGALDLYRVAMGQYPEELKQLVEPPDDEEAMKKWKVPYIKEKDLVDPWGQEWYYQFPGENNKDGFDLGSNGPDKEWGTDDDLRNWKES